LTQARWCSSRVLAARAVVETKVEAPVVARGAVAAEARLALATERLVGHVDADGVPVTVVLARFALICRVAFGGFGGT